MDAHSYQNLTLFSHLNKAISLHNFSAVTINCHKKIGGFFSSCVIKCSLTSKVGKAA